MPARLIRIHGRVQGVGFRWWTHSQATGLGVAGTVRNRSDGTVEVIAFGSEQLLLEFVGRLRNGPSGARVDRIEEHPLDDGQPAPSSFRITG